MTPTTKKHKKARKMKKKKKQEIQDVNERYPVENEEKVGSDSRLAEKK